MYPFDLEKLIFWPKSIYTCLDIQKSCLLYKLLFIQTFKDPPSSFFWKLWCHCLISRLLMLSWSPQSLGDFDHSKLYYNPIYIFFCSWRALPHPDGALGFFIVHLPGVSISFSKFFSLSHLPDILLDTLYGGNFAILNTKRSTPRSTYWFPWFLTLYRTIHWDWHLICDPLGKGSIHSGLEFSW